MIDATQHSAVAVCDHCGRREVTTSRETARAWAAQHEALAHPESRKAREAARVAATRRPAGECTQSVVP